MAAHDTTASQTPEQIQPKTPAPRKLRRKHKNMFRDEKGRWWIDYYRRDAEGKLTRHKKLCGKTKESAERMLRTIRVAVDKSEYVDPFQAPRLADYVKDFRANSDKVSHRKAGARFDRLTGFFGHLKLSQITPKLIERFQLERRESGTGRNGKTPVKPATINREVQLLRAILGKAVRGRELAHNPATAVKNYKEAPPRDKFLHRPQIRKLLLATKQSQSPLLRSVVYFALETGMRKSEIFNLKWVDVDFASGQLLVTKTKTNTPRHIPLSRRARWLLSKRAAKAPLSTYVFESESRDGKRQPVVDVKKAWHTALLRAGISDFRFHDLRHTFASQFAMKGGNLYALAVILGHANPAITLKVYAKLSPEFLRSQVATMDRKLFESEPSGKRMDTERVSDEERET